MSKRRLRITQSSALRSKLVEAGTRKVALTLEDTNPFAKRPNLAADVVELRRRKAAQLMAGYYSGTLRALQGVLDNPGAPVTLAPASFRFHRSVDVSVGNHGSRMPQTESIRLESGVTTNSKWDGLGRAYARSEGKRWEGLPVSRTFWRKTGKLRDAYSAWFASQQARLLNPKTYFVGRPEEVTNSSARLKTKYQPAKGYGYSSSAGAYLSKSTKSVLAQWQVVLAHPNLGNPILDMIIRNAYVYGSARGFDMKVGDPLLERVQRTIDVTYSKGKLKGRTIQQRRMFKDEGINRMGLAEARRPMISRFARAAGQRELEALRKLLKR